MSVTKLDEAELAARATAAVATRFPGATVTNVEQLIGGTSSLTYVADMTVTNVGGPNGGGPNDGAHETRRAVIKAAPPGLEPVRNRDVLRQARLFDVLVDHPEVKVPRVYGTSDGDPPDVPPLFVMSYIAGESYEPALTADEPTVSLDELQQRAFGAARMAAALHSVDIGAGPLAAERVTDLGAEVERWARAFGSVDDELRAGHERVCAALLAQLPQSQSPSVLHGDFRLGNMQCNGGSVDALIDWEIWSLGDRRLDVAWFLLNSDPRHPNSRKTDTGLPEPAALIAAYEEMAGVTIEGLGWFNALVRYKQAAASVLIIKNNRKLAQPGVSIEAMLDGRSKLLDSALEQLG